MSDVEGRSKLSEAAMAIEEVAVVRQALDTSIEAGKKPSDPGNAYPRRLSRLEPRDR
jgi:hypothetical protein